MRSSKINGSFLHIIDFIGVAIAAITGALAAGGKKMDMVGIVVVAIVTAIGGGTLRDVLLGIKPVLWVADPMYVIVAAAAGLLIFVLVRFVTLSENTFLVLDAFVLAMYTVVGCQRAMSVNAPDVIIAIMGVMTGVAGGVIRDVLCARIPLVLVKKELYATASLIGAILYLIIYRISYESNLSMICAIICVAAVRLAAMRWKLTLPAFSYNNKTEEA